jgi:hypothetical protein
MRITGGNLHLLFGKRSLAELQTFFAEAANGVNFLDAPTQYFLPIPAGEMDPYHRAFACFPKEPFDSPCEIGFGSKFVIEMVVARSQRLEDIRFLNGIRAARNISTAIFEFGMDRPTVRGILLEDIRYDRIISANAAGLHFEFHDPETKEYFCQASIPTVPIHQRGKLATLPTGHTAPFLWVSTSRNNARFDSNF